MTTIRDVAALAGVSVATVSRALSGSDRVTPATREKVEAAAAQLKYRPNAVAAAMRTGRTGVVGLVIADLTNPFMTRLAAHLENVCREHGWVLAIASGSEDVVKQARATATLLQQRVDGLFIIPAGDPNDELHRLIAGQEAVVALDRASSLESNATILTETRPALASMAAHLKEQGYQRPAIVCGPDNISTGLMRADHCREALIEAGFDGDIHVLPGQFNAEHGRTATAHLLDNGNDPDVILTLANLMAQGALAELQSRGIAVGPEVGLTAFDEEPWFALTAPPLSCVTQPIEALARAGVDAMARILDHQTVGPEPTVVVSTPYAAARSPDRCAWRARSTRARPTRSRCRGTRLHPVPVE